MKSISEMQRQSANVNMPEKAGSIADAFCRAYYAAGAVERALGRTRPIGERVWRWPPRA